MTIGLGCWGLGSESYGEVGEESARELIHCAVDEGVEFYDTAPLYGYGLSEIRLGKYLPKSDVFRIATKVGIIRDSGGIIEKRIDPKLILQSVEESLRRLCRDSVYLLQLHSPEINFENEEILETLVNLKSSGKVQNIGISLKNPDILPFQEDLLPWDAFQYNCSILDQRISKYRTILDSKFSEGVILIARTPLNFGFLGTVPPDINNLPLKHHLTNWPVAQLNLWSSLRTEVQRILEPSGTDLLNAAIRFPIDSHLANLVIPGAIDREQLLENLRAYAKPLPEDVSALLSTLVPNIKIESSPYGIKIK